MVRIWARPGSETDSFEGIDRFRKALVVKVRARAREGQANDAILRMLSRCLSASVTLESGGSGRLKVIRVHDPGIEKRDSLLSLLASFQ